MDRIRLLREIIDQKTKAADHLLAVTYPVIKEPKLLILVIENVFYALNASIDAILEYENLFKKEYETKFDEKYTMFKRKIVSKYDIKKETTEFIEKIKKIIDEHKKTAVTFIKKDKLIITDENYNLTKLSPDKCKKILHEAKKHIQILINTVKQ